METHYIIALAVIFALYLAALVKAVTFIESVVDGLSDEADCESGTTL